MPTGLASRLLLFLIAVLIASACKKSPAGYDNSKPAWYKQAIIYNLDVKVFKDSDGDGLGDFNGLTSKLDYLLSLGVNTIWLAPFQPSPWEDDGYDITDYMVVDQRLGSEQDFKNFIKAAKAKHIRVIMDMVLNHTSSRHPWFLASKDSSSVKRNWYLWSRQRPKDWDKGMGFPEVEKESWRFDSAADAYYFHRFYRFEPDLNFQNPALMQESKRILDHWLSLGLDGFRFDAVPFIIDDPRKSSEKPDHDFTLLHQLAGYIKVKNPQALILGEANISPEENRDYFSKNNDGLDMMLNFEVNEYTFLALATGKTKELKKALEVTAKKPASDQWAVFLRNHDEVDLGKLNKKDFELVNQKMGPDSNMQLYGRGIRRRLAPMLNNNQQRLQLAYSLLYALPGTPILRYGEEIGMGDDLHLFERLAVRTPMQWDSSANAGFSKAKKTFRPVIDTGLYSYKAVSVQKQSQQYLSLLNYIRRLSSLRKQYQLAGKGQWKLLETNTDNVLCLLHEDGKGPILTVFNFAERPLTAEIKTDLSGSADKELLTGQASKLSITNGKLTIPLTGYGAQWLLWHVNN
ncbi:alpha-amylase family protein [Mucilaginibacter pallidiroseus]|nr:alpha-amylase family protein [Mucilaginibacter pallidiroseus]